MNIIYIDRIRTVKCRSRITLGITIFLLLSIFSSCKKDKLDDQAPAAIQPFNALDDDILLRANLSGKHPIRYSDALSISNKLYNQRIIYIKSFLQNLAFYADKDTMPQDKPLISTDLNLESGKIYSMFIYGEKSTAAFTLEEDIFPAIKQNDSLTYVRFANFSEGQTISVNIKGEAPGSYIQSLPFKSRTNFVELSVKSSISNYEFEIRDQASGNLLTTYTADVKGTTDFYPWIYKPNTLVFTGRPSGTGFNQQKVILMRHL